MLGAFAVQFPVVRWAAGLHGLVAAHKILPAQPHDELSITSYAGRQPLQISLLNRVIRNLGFVALGITDAPKPRRNYKPVTHTFGKVIPWFQAAAPGDAQEGGQRTDLLPSVFCHTSARRGASALTGGCIPRTVLNGHWWLLLPFFWLNPF